MKKIPAALLTICIVASAFSLPALSADLSTLNVASQLNTDKASVSIIDVVLNETYIALAIACIGLIASIISVVLLVVDRRKEAAEGRKKDCDENENKNNKKRDTL